MTPLEQAAQITYCPYQDKALRLARDIVAIAGSAPAEPPFGAMAFYCPVKAPVGLVMSEHLATSAEIAAEQALDELYSFLDRNGASKRLAYSIDRLVQARIEQALEDERRARFAEIEALRDDVQEASGVRP